MLLERERERPQSDPGPSAFKLKLRRVRPDVAFSIQSLHDYGQLTAQL